MSPNTERSQQEDTDGGIDFGAQTLWIGSNKKSTLLHNTKDCNKKRQNDDEHAHHYGWNQLKLISRSSQKRPK